MKVYTSSDIKKLRKHSNMTQKELASLTGLSQSLIAKIENKLINPSYNTMMKIIDSLENIKKQNKSILGLINKKIYFITRKGSVKEALDIMKRKGVSQLPILEDDMYFGVVSEKSFIQNFEKNKKIEEYVDYDPPVVSKNTSYEIIGYLLKENEIILIKDKQKIIGIISRQDWFDDQFR
ncbi:MAG: CBS domain-containing protein [Candidatus Woesearchaeota archaeon]